MKRLYFKGSEKHLECFIKIVLNKSLVTANILIRSPDNSWEVRSRIFNLDNEAEKTEYSNFKEHYFETDWMEFEVARKKMIEQTKTTTQGRLTFPLNADDILKKIAKFQKNNPEEKKDQ